jgi:hypothetical protein
MSPTPIGSMDNEQERAAVARSGADLESGAWGERYGHLRGMDELTSDCGWSSAISTGEPEP